MLIGKCEEVRIRATGVEAVATVHHGTEVILGEFPLLLPQMSLAAESISCAFGYTAVIGAARCVFGGESFTFDALGEVIDDEVPYGFLGIAPFGVFVRSKVLFVNRNTPPEAVETVVVIGPKETALCNSLCL